MTSYCHAPIADAVDWTGPFQSREEAIQHARSTHGRARGFYIRPVVFLRAEEFVPSGAILTDTIMAELWTIAYAKFGDRADAFPDIDEVSEAAREELHALVKSWVQRRVRNAWSPSGEAVRVEAMTQLALVPRHDLPPTHSTIGLRNVK